MISQSIEVLYTGLVDPVRLEAILLIAVEELHQDPIYLLDWYEHAPTKAVSWFMAAVAVECKRRFHVIPTKNELRHCCDTILHSAYDVLCTMEMLLN